MLICIHSLQATRHLRCSCICVSWKHWTQALISRDAVSQQPIAADVHTYVTLMNDIKSPDNREQLLSADTQSCTTTHLPVPRRNKKGTGAEETEWGWRTTWSHGIMSAQRRPARSKLHSGNKPFEKTFACQLADRHDDAWTQAFYRGGIMMVLYRRPFDRSIAARPQQKCFVLFSYTLIQPMSACWSQSYLLIFVIQTQLKFTKLGASQRKMYYAAIRIFSPSLIWTHH